MAGRKTIIASHGALFVRPGPVFTGRRLAVLLAVAGLTAGADAQSAPASRALEGRSVAASVATLASSARRASPVLSAPLAAAAPAISFAPVPFAVGEELTYKVSFGGIPAGSARMRVDGIEMVRNRPAYHVVFSIDGGVPFFRVHDRYESWIDVQTLASLRYRQVISEGGYKRNTTFEIFPERAQFQRDGEPMEASVAHPLDDGSFIYAVRTAKIRVGETRRDDRYFRPDRNPVILTGLRSDTVSVGAGRFATTVVRPSIRANGLFSENGDAQIWFSDDASRVPVQMKTKFSRFSLTMTLHKLTRGNASAHQQLLQTAMGK